MASPLLSRGNHYPGITELMNIKCFALLSVIVAAAIQIQAVPATFDLRDTTATAEIESGTIVRGGITATLTANVVGNTGVLNQTAGGFGIDASGSDASSQIDGEGGIESIGISFDADVYFTGLTLSSFTTSEHAILSIAGFTSLSITGLSPAIDVYSFTSNNLVLAGQTVLLKYGDGNGVSFDSFTVDPVRTASSSVPETLPFSFIACFLITLLACSHCLLACRTAAVFAEPSRSTKR